MPHYGPWIDEGPQTATFTLDLALGEFSFGTWTNSGMDFATICEVGGGPGTFNFDAAALVALSGPGVLLGYAIEGTRIALPITATRMPGMYSFTLPEPAGAVGFQVEGYSDDVGVDPDITWITSGLSVSGDHWILNPGLDPGHALGGELQIRSALTSPGSSTAALSAFLPGATLATIPLLSTRTFADGDCTIDYTPGFIIPRSHIPASGVGALADVVAHMRAVVDHVAPTGTYDTALGGDQSFLQGAMTGDNPFGGGNCIYTVSFTYHRPRYRFIFNTLNKLRQSPRDDFLGGAPRQGHRNGPTSVQASTRQGWRGTYR